MITSGSDTNGQLGATVINGGDTVSLGVVLTTTSLLENGIRTTNYSNKVTVSTNGIITTGGIAATGISNINDDNETNVSGSIETAGENSSGILNIGNTNETSVSGTVKVTATSSTALYNWSGDGNSFTLNEGTIITGDILADDTSTVFDSEPKLAGFGGP